MLGTADLAFTAIGVVIGSGIFLVPGLVLANAGTNTLLALGVWTAGGLLPGYPVTPLLFVASAAALVLNTIASQPKRAGIGLAVVLSGVPAYYWWRRTTRASSASPASSVPPPVCP